MLIEGQPKTFRRLRDYRPGSVALGTHTLSPRIRSRSSALALSIHSLTAAKCECKSATLLRASATHSGEHREYAYTQHDTQRADRCACACCEDAPASSGVINTPSITCCAAAVLDATSSGSHIVSRRPLSPRREAHLRQVGMAEKDEN